MRSLMSIAILRAIHSCLIVETETNVVAHRDLISASTLSRRAFGRADGTGQSGGCGSMLRALTESLLRRKDRPNDRYDADELRYKYGDSAQLKAFDRSRDRALSRRERRHWHRVSELLRR